MAGSAASRMERYRRGSIPPHLNLQEAFRFVQGIYEHGGGQASYDVASQLLGNSSSSSSFVKKIGAAKLYGLISEQNGTLFLTDIGNAIAAPLSETAALNAKKAAFLNVATFAKVYERHKGKLVPADEFLKNIIEQEAGIPRELSFDWVQAFHQAARAAGLIYSRPDGKIQLLETGITHKQILPAEASNTPPPISDSETTAQKSVRPVDPSATQSVPVSASGQQTRFLLSDGRMAEFNIPFGITQSDAKRLKSYLKGLDLIIDSAVSESSGSEKDGST